MLNVNVEKIQARTRFTSGDASGSGPHSDRSPVLNFHRVYRARPPFSCRVSRQHLTAIYQFNVQTFTGELMYMNSPISSIAMGHLGPEAIKYTPISWRTGPLACRTITPVSCGFNHLLLLWCVCDFLQRKGGVLSSFEQDCRQMDRAWDRQPP